MNTETLNRAIGKIDEDLVLQAGSYQTDQRYRAIWPLCSGMTACLLLLAGLAAIVLKKIFSSHAFPDPAVVLPSQSTEQITRVISRLLPQETEWLIAALILIVLAAVAVVLLFHNTIRKRKQR